MPRRTTQLPLDAADQIARYERVEEQMTRLLEGFRELRKRKGRGRFGDLDQALGRASGYLSDVFAGNERLGFERFLASLDFLETYPSEFFEQHFSSPLIPRAPIGWLLDFKESRGRSRLVPESTRLVQWARAIRVRSDGTHFSGDPTSLRAHANRDLDGALHRAVASLNAFFLSEPGGVHSSTAGKLSCWLTILAHIVRTKDDRNLAAELFDAAFRIEDQIDDMAIRSFIYRLAAYLLSDFGNSAEAEMFARRAVRLATSSDGRELLGQALYVEGMMVSYQGRVDEALTAFQACLMYLEGIETETVASAWHHIAIIYLQGQQIEQAEAALAGLETALGTTSGPNYAKLLAIRGEVAASRTEVQQALGYFDAAMEIFAAIENPAEVALVGLQKLRCLLEAGRLAEANKTANRLLALARPIRGNKVGESILLEVGRLSGRGQLTTARIREAIRVWQCPEGPSAKTWFSH